MSGNTTVVLRKGSDSLADRLTDREQELRFLLLSRTIREARAYAEDYGALVVLGALARNEGTAVAELAREALFYPATLAELSVCADEVQLRIGAAWAVRDRFRELVEKEKEFPRQRVIVEIMRAWAASEPNGSRRQFVGEHFLKHLYPVARDEQPKTLPQPYPKSLKEGVARFLGGMEYSVDGFIDCMSKQPREELLPIMRLLHEIAKTRQWPSAMRARTLLKHLEP